MSDALCWTSLVGATEHNLGDLPEKCFTCAAKRREDFQRLTEGVAKAVIVAEKVPVPADAVLIGDDVRDFWRLAPRDTKAKVGQD